MRFFSLIYFEYSQSNEKLRMENKNCNLIHVIEIIFLKLLYEKCGWNPIKIYLAVPLCIVYDWLFVLLDLSHESK